MTTIQIKTKYGKKIHKASASSSATRCGHWLKTEASNFAINMVPPEVKAETHCKKCYNTKTLGEAVKETYGDGETAHIKERPDFYKDWVASVPGHLPQEFKKKSQAVRHLAKHGWLWQGVKIGATPLSESMDMNNNESKVRGVFYDAQYDEFTAMTYSASKGGFKTHQGAINWLRKRHVDVKKFLA